MERESGSGTARLSAGTYLTALWREAGPRVALAVVSSAVTALTEGALLLLLAPLLSLAGLTGKTAMTGALPRTLQALGLADLPDRIGEGGLILVWIAAASGLTVLSSLRELDAQSIQERFSLMMRRRFQSAAMQADWMALQRERASDIVATLSDTLGRVGEGVVQLITLAARLLGVAVLIAVAVAVAPGPSAVVLLVGLTFVPFQARRLRVAFRKGRRVTRGSHAVQSIVSDHFAAIKLAKAHGAEDGLSTHFVRALDVLRENRLAFFRQRIVARTGFRISALLGFAVVIWVSVTELGADGPVLLLLVALFARLLPLLNEALNSAHMFAESLAAWAEAEKLFRRLAAAAGPAYVAEVAPPAGDIRFERVTLTWQGRDAPAIGGIDLTIADRRTTALVGPSGAGKSTIADLALGLLVPTSGRVLVGDRVLDGPHRMAWHRGAAYVPQADVLFHDSVRANLLWARPDAGDAALWQALRTAALDTVVARLPHGLDTVLGDRGAHLSGGERQRLGLARALLREPAFLVLDEATSHLDAANERLVQDALNRLQHSMTILVIAHRLDTVRRADHIAVIEAGRVVEQGTWDELVARPDGWLGRSVA